MAKFHRLDPIPLYSTPVSPADPNSAWTFEYLEIGDEGMSSGETSSSDARKKRKKKKAKKRNWGGY